MFKQCDDCKGIFKIPRVLEKYLETHPEKNIHCPYCDGVWSHIHSPYRTEKVMSKRGTLI